jgi:hypothetical protein
VTSMGYSPPAGWRASGFAITKGAAKRNLDAHNRRLHEIPRAARRIERHPAYRGHRDTADVNDQRVVTERPRRRDLPSFVVVRGGDPPFTASCARTDCVAAASNRPVVKSRLTRGCFPGAGSTTLLHACRRRTMLFRKGTSSDQADLDRIYLSRSRGRVTESQTAAVSKKASALLRGTEGSNPSPFQR